MVLSYKKITLTPIRKEWQKKRAAPIGATRNGNEMNTLKFDPSELCSRKLWELVSMETEEQVGERELKEAIAELAARRHYLEQLQQIGAIENKSPGA
tara:strand:+ start:86265 stop:86555 length:291 start_codon:yes stop_codon:yes gene_type:complete